MSGPFSLDKKDLLHIAKVLGYSVAASIVTAITVAISHAQIAPEYAILVPVVNSALVALELFFKDNAK